IPPGVWGITNSADLCNKAVCRTPFGVLEQLTTMHFQKYFLNIAFLLGKVQMGQRNAHSNRFSY
ncbi:hypothetical protein, partial [Massilia timonae]|uniref:hypothetical protein n=1 Tax=Massilia timonae TaxID=47229 RepID=UPI0028A85676